MKRIISQSRAIKIIVLIVGVSFYGFPIIAQDWDLEMSLKGKWKFTIGDNLEWADPSLNDRDWENVTVPSPWEDQGFHGFDGFAWYRRTFSGANLDRFKDLYLFLGNIDDADEVFVNGRLIGSSGSFPPKFATAFNAYRRYLVPKGYIRYDNTNVISVRVYDRHGVGGIVSGDVGFYSREGAPGLVVDMHGIWSFKKGDNNKWREKYWNDGDWESITVPSPWENQGYKNYDGYGWYRKTFYLPKNQSASSLVLVLGRIDDFDQVYINGRLIGSTNDGKRFGFSWSFRELRTYRIPDDLLEEGKSNVIAVRVYDMGGEGGIYEGPVGIIRRSGLREFLQLND